MELLNGVLLSSGIAAQKIPVHMDEVIKFEDESAYRFESMTRRFRAIEGVTNRKVEFMEMAVYPVVMVASGANTAGAIPVDHPEYAHTDQLVYNTRTHETYIMNEAIGGTGTAGSITVINLAGSGNPTTATAVGDVLLVMPEAHAEGEAIPAAYTNKPEFKSTYIMQSDKTLHYSDFAKGYAEYGEKQYLADRRQAWINYKQMQNLALLLGGESLETTSGAGRRYKSRGLRDWITSNRISMSGVPAGFTLKTLGMLLRNTTVIGASSDSKIGVAGQNAMVSLSDMPASAIRTTVNSTEWGAKITSVVTPFGNLAFDYDKSLSGEFGLADVFVIYDGKSVKRLEFAGMSPKMLMNVQNATDIHNYIDVITGTWGLKVELEKLNAWISGIQ